ncbi:MAG TPA: beta-L-arabinofuranosidase domain-containing protein [Propionibacteriaceae bacterium]|nr:beta-L-arabinofuranosidase domain-containing protein [Propionibacteriaceae bacterium]
MWADRRRINRDVSVPAAWDRLHEAGNFHNLKLAAGEATGTYVNDLPFLDSDVYKWLEAIGWTLADEELTGDARVRLQQFLDWSIELLARAQQDDGYLDSNFQVRFPGERFAQLQWGHELYCAGHLVQAAIALHRTTGDSRLLEIARRFADLIVRSFGTGAGEVDGIDGHPEIETALVELYRETGEKSYLDKAQYFIDRRGYGLLGPDRFGSHYWQDHQPVREASSAEGHSVRQLYLLAGVADLYVEAGDHSLRESAERIWAEMAATKTYLTGGIGAHHLDESFGDPYELPNERSYCETCAAIASIMFSWRMLMITGESRYADVIERTLYNGFLGGLSLDGQKYIYANPLQVREGHLAGGNDHDYRRTPWFHCACCPPNVMRTLAQLEHYVLLSSSSEVTLHQYIPGRYGARLAAGEVSLRVETEYPWEGQVRVVVETVPGGRFALTVRVPHWAGGATLQLNTEPIPAEPRDGWLTLVRDWRAGDELLVNLPLDIRFTRADPRLDAARGCVALERGPLVYCLEAVDNPGQRLDDVIIDTSAAATLHDGTAELPGVMTALQAHGFTRARAGDSWWPYTSEPPQGNRPPHGSSVRLTAVPYFAWGNREEGAMRVWIPAE